MSSDRLFDSSVGRTLDALRSEAAGPADAGRRFERLMRRAFETHPHEYGPARFKRVWLWSEWPQRTEFGYGQDIGIDLVADQTAAYGGGLCAIQCKNYAEGHKVPTSGVDSFLAASGTARFTHRILVITSDLERAGRTKVDNASPRCEVIGPDRLDSWPAAWREFIDRPEELTFEHCPHTPRPDQREALDAIAKGRLDHSRGRLIMPCGTGKSLVAMWGAEENVPDGGDSAVPGPVDRVDGPDDAGVGEQPQPRPGLCGGVLGPHHRTPRRGRRHSQRPGGTVDAGLDRRRRHRVSVADPDRRRDQGGVQHLPVAAGAEVRPARRVRVRHGGLRRSAPHHRSRRRR